MAWEWSHSEEAYQNAYDNLKAKSQAWLQVCLAEIMSNDDNGFNDDKFNHYLKQFESDNFMSDFLSQAIWTFMTENRTCDNGGFNAWCCPYGCHTVSFD